MPNVQPLDPESSAVQAHLTIVQDVIQRMAENSRSCKVWCVTLVAAVLVLVARTGEPKHALIAIVPIILFLVLDTYYLALERGFRCSYNYYVKRLTEGKATITELYKVAPRGSTPKHFFSRLLKSFAVLPFYLSFVVTVVLAWLLIY